MENIFTNGLCQMVHLRMRNCMIHFAEQCSQQLHSSHRSYFNGTSMNFQKKLNYFTSTRDVHGNANGNCTMRRKK